MIFFTSDTHLGHGRIIELADRPFIDVHQMNYEIIQRWNEVVAPEDFVFHLGDVALGTIAESLPLVAQLNGHKSLIVGNHDRLFPSFKPAHRERFNPLYKQVFEHVHMPPGITLPFEGRHLNLSHFPYDGDSHDDDRFTESRFVDNGWVLLHGHTHSHDVVTYSKNHSLQIHVGQDAWDYRPVSLNEIREILSTQGY